MISFFLKQWKITVLLVVIIDTLVVAGVLYSVANRHSNQVSAAELAVAGSPAATATATATPWPGPGQRVTPTPTLPPTPMPTEVLAESGFPVGFTPTPRPTREQVMLTLPYVFPVYGNNLDVPVINQIYYPEPFFPPGTNNACGPVALYAAVQALGANIDYSRLRNHAVNYGFTDYGISKSGLIGTLAALNRELGEPMVYEEGNNYSTTALIKQIRTGGVAIVLLQVQKSNGQWRVTADTAHSIGHFLIVDSVNLRSKTVQFAGSTLGMDKVPLQDFIQSWSHSSQAVVDASSLPAWQDFLRHEPSDKWALIIRRNRR
jgi:hypothetical protein